MRMVPRNPLHYLIKIKHLLYLDFFFFPSRRPEPSHVALIVVLERSDSAGVRPHGGCDSSKGERAVLASSEKPEWRPLTFSPLAVAALTVGSQRRTQTF